MAETKINSDNSGNQIKHSNPSVQPLAVGAGVPATSVSKTVGNPNGAAHGQVPSTAIVFHNPA